MPFFSFLSALAGTSRTEMVLDRNGESGYSCLVLDLRGKAPSLSRLNAVLAVGRVILRLPGKLAGYSLTTSVYEKDLSPLAPWQHGSPRFYRWGPQAQGGEVLHAPWHSCSAAFLPAVHSHWRVKPAGHLAFLPWVVMPWDPPRAATSTEGRLGSVLGLTTKFLYDLGQVAPSSLPWVSVFPSVQWKRWATQVLLFLTAAAAAKSLQSCLTLCDPRDGSPPGSPVPGILQARTLEWVAISFSNAWK